MTSDKARPGAIRSCYATQPRKTAASQWRPLMFTLSAKRVIHRGVKKCLVLVKHDQIVMQMNHRSTHKGQDIFTERDKTTKLLNNDCRFTASSEEEGDSTKPQSKDNVAWLSKDSAVRRKQRSRGTADYDITGSTTKVGVH